MCGLTIRVAAATAVHHELACERDRAASAVLEHADTAATRCSHAWIIQGARDVRCGCRIASRGREAGAGRGLTWHDLYAEARRRAQAAIASEAASDLVRGHEP